MPTVKISQLTPKGAPLADTDLLAIAEQGVGTYDSKSITGLNIVDRAQQGMQPELISGTNIKTINGSSILGSGDLTVNSVNPTDNFVPFNDGGIPVDSPFSIVDPPAGYFGWSGFQTKLGTMIVPPSGYDQTNIASQLDNYGINASKTSFESLTVIGDYVQNGGLNFGLVDSVLNGSYALLNNMQGNHLYMDFSQQIYYFGYQYGYYPYPVYGLQIDGAHGTFSMNAGSNPYDPPFQYEGASGTIKMVDQFGGGWMGFNGGNAFINVPNGYAIIDSPNPINFSNAGMFATGVGTFTITDKALAIIDNNFNTYYLPLYTI